MAAPPMQADMRHGGHAAMGSPSARSLAPNAHMQGHPSDGSPVLGHEDFRYTQAHMPSWNGSTKLTVME